MSKQIKLRILEKRAVRAQAAEPAPIIVPKSAQKKTNFSLVQMVMGTAIMFMALATLGLYSHKSKVVAATPPPPAVVVVSPVETKLNAIDERLSKLELSVKRVHHYSWLSMLATNHNATMNKIGSKDYVLFDKDGNLDHKPSSLKFTDEQEAAFENGVK